MPNKEPLKTIGGCSPKTKRKHLPIEQAKFFSTTKKLSKLYSIINKIGCENH